LLHLGFLDSLESSSAAVVCGLVGALFAPQGQTVSELGCLIELSFRLPLHTPAATFLFDAGDDPMALLKLVVFLQREVVSFQQFTGVLAFTLPAHITQTVFGTAASGVLTFRFPLHTPAAPLLFDAGDKAMALLKCVIFSDRAAVRMQPLAGIFPAALLAPVVQPVCVSGSFVEPAFVFPLFAFSALFHFFLLPQRFLFSVCLQVYHRRRQDARFYLFFS